MNAEDRKKCANEVDILKSVGHEHIITYYDHFVSNNELYIIMELADGGLPR
jgi:serine/threonine protein kinase